MSSFLQAHLKSHTNEETIIGHLDGVEGALDDLKTYTDGLEGKIDAITGPIQLNELAHTTMGARSYVYAHDVANSKAKALRCDAQGRLECSVDALEVSADTINLNTDQLEGKLDTINTTLSSGIGGLPANLTGSGNLKVSLQELGNEGSERLNVDVGNSVSQLPTALTGEGNLKVSIQEDFTHNLSTSAKQDDLITAQTLTTTTINSRMAVVATSNDNIKTAVDSLGTNLLLPIAPMSVASVAILAKNTEIETTLNSILEKNGEIENHLETISEFNLDTSDVTISSGVVLPSALTGSGNLKVCIQELGNEGSERLNVDVGNDITQLPTALSGSGRLKIENDFDGAITNAHLTELGTALNSAKLDVNISSGGFGGAITNAHLTELGTALNSAKLDVNISSGGFDGAITNAHLTELGSAINSDKVDVNISSGGFDGAITNAHLTELGTALNSAKLDVNISSGGFDGAITNAHLTELGTALNSAKLDVNISSGNISGFATSAKQDTQETSLNAIETEVKLGQTCEDQEVIDNDGIAPETLSIAIDTESYSRIRLYGNTTASPASLGGSDLNIWGSNSSSGTYYNLPDAIFQTTTYTLSGTGAVYSIGVSLENVPRYLKVFNKHGSTTYTITKLRMVGNNKMVNV
jgi:hypothetical protein